MHGVVSRVQSIALLVLLLGVAICLPEGVVHGSGEGDYRFSLMWSWSFISTGSIAVDDAGNVYVSDTYNHRIQKFASSGAFITKWGSPGT